MFLPVVSIGKHHISYCCVYFALHLDLGEDGVTKNELALNHVRSWIPKSEHWAVEMQKNDSAAGSGLHADADAETGCAPVIRITPPMSTNWNILEWKGNIPKEHCGLCLYETLDQTSRVVSQPFPLKPHKHAILKSQKWWPLNVNGTSILSIKPLDSRCGARGLENGSTQSRADTVARRVFDADSTLIFSLLRNSSSTHLFMQRTPQLHKSPTLKLWVRCWKRFYWCNSSRHRTIWPTIECRNGSLDAVTFHVNMLKRWELRAESIFTRDE